MGAKERIDDAILALEAAKRDLEVATLNLVDLPAWYCTALGELGVREIAGAKHEPRIIEYHSVTIGPGSTDEIPWCSSFVCWCMSRAGLAHTRSKAARSWLDWGVELDEPRLGCVVVLERPPNPMRGHVALFHSFSTRDTVRLVGGNQQNAVRVSDYPRARVLSYRWPLNAHMG